MTVLSPPLPTASACRRHRRLLLTTVVVWACALTSGTVAVAQEPGAAYFRIFLTDGTTLTSYGDFARVGERVVFSLPLGELQGQPRLHLASVPAERVDWTTTERYREGTRAAHYAATRGEEDFAILSSDVARLLNDIALSTEPSRRLALASEARERLAAWPADHYGYRLEEIRQILGLVDEVVSELRASAGDSRFDLALVAGVAGPPPVTPLPPPSLQESIAQALWAARLAGSAAERRTLLEAALGSLDVHAATLPVGWMTTTRARATTELAHEARVDAQLGGVRARAFGQIDRLTARADVRGVERLVGDVRKQLSPLADERSDEVQALLDTLDARLDATRRLRLARDQWEVKADALRQYERAISPSLRILARGREGLDDIRTLAGPSVDVLSSLDRQLGRVAQQLAKIAVPADGQAVHAVITSAVQLAANAVRLRRTAVSSGNMQQAWDASAAAAGAMLLLDRAREDVTRLLQPPELQ